MQKLSHNHYPPTVEAALRLLRLRVRTRSVCAALGERVAVMRTNLRQSRDAWDEAVDALRAANAEVGLRDTALDAVVKVELKAGLGAMTATMPKAQRDALSAKLFEGKAPAEAMKPLGGPVQAQYVDKLLGHLATPEFAALRPVADKIAVLRKDLADAETARMECTTRERVSHAALDDMTDAAKQLYNQTFPELQLLVPNDETFVESCFMDLRALAHDQGPDNRNRVLLSVYRARFGAVPHHVQAALEGTEDDATFARLLETFATKTAEEISAALVPETPAS